METGSSLSRCRGSIAGPRSLTLYLSIAECAVLFSYSLSLIQKALRGEPLELSKHNRNEPRLGRGGLPMTIALYKEQDS